MYDKYTLPMNMPAYAIEVIRDLSGFGALYDKIMYKNLVKINIENRLSYTTTKGER